MHRHEHYETQRRRYHDRFRQAARTFNVLTWSRLALALLAVGAGVQVVRAPDTFYAVLLVAATVGFFVLVRRHAQVRYRMRFYEQLVRINEHELAALAGDYSAFDDGARYVDPQHPYTFDLDVFGPYSIYQAINRTANLVGADALARAFIQSSADSPQAAGGSALGFSSERTEEPALTADTPGKIRDRQQALQDLAARLEWRQHFLAEGQLHADARGQYRKLLDWAARPPRPAPALQQVLWFALPVLTVAAGVGGVLLADATWWKAFSALAMVNLGILAAHAKTIRSELSYLDSIYQIIAQYGQLLRRIETEPFVAPHLQALQQRLRAGEKSASNAVGSLANLLHQLESVQNLIASVLFNSTLLYHVHVLGALERWKRRHAGAVSSWIETVGELEALCSLAHFAFNNPDFTYPEIAAEPVLELPALGHPLIPAGERVCNDVAFSRPGFVILTGSNMSGKSTFLRTLGLNLLLARIGTPVCAAAGRVFPFEIHVCMKLSDSLHDHESYFYAELKRLHRIIGRLEAGPPCFVLLDEVLRGTNSNDKLHGTLGLLETMVRLRATGVLATHDLAVCELAAKYPDYLRNWCFEVEMTADNLVFDYKLREGVCVNKSASFLMKKMGVIN